MVDVVVSAAYLATLRKAGEFTTFWVVFQKLMNENKINGVAYLEAIQAAWALGNEELAKALLSEAESKKFPTTRICSSYIKGIKGLVQSESLAEAEILCENIIGNGIANDIIYNDYALLLKKMGNFVRAEQIFRIAENSGEINEIGYLLWIDCLWEQNKIDEAEALFLRSPVSLVIKEEGGLFCLDLHGYTAGSAIVALKLFMEQLTKEQGELPTHIGIICGQALHSRTEGGVLKKFILKHAPTLPQIEQVQEDSHNAGRLNVSLKSVKNCQIKRTYLE